MENEGNNNKKEIKSWLDIVLKNENLKDFSVKVVGNSEKGDGYMGDIVFVEINGINEEGSKKEYHLVLKCAKRSSALREKSPVKEAFLNEIFFYNTIFPKFLQFQHERNVDEPFDKVPKCYGTLVQGEMEVLVLENLKKKGYILWDRTTPLTRKHIDLIVKGYGTFHAVSIVMEKEQPHEFRRLTQQLENVFEKFLESSDMLAVFEDTVDETFELLKDEIEENIILRWQNLKNDVRPFFSMINKQLDGLNVITHGDCWSNNFMHYHINDEPTTFAMLDWQIARYTSPIMDLSYFLFSCLSKEDMYDLDSVLIHYHKSLMTHLEKLGVRNPEHIYPLKQFFIDWKKYSKFGILFAQIIHKFSLSEKEDVPDMMKVAERGEDIAKAFSEPVKNVSGYKNRMGYIIKCAVKYDLL